ncbi:hypothetical protein J2R76_003565 [Bradyrhizobium sp. USDA 4532]|nr:hypothetical protein [Bradyrhizobium sp. USDA 4545]MCP1919974.1 hypothetical protein [Bradyrhizobium sp. USDA 4532]
MHINVYNSYACPPFIQGHLDGDTKAAAIVLGRQSYPEGPKSENVHEKRIAMQVCDPSPSRLKIVFL